MGHNTSLHILHLRMSDTHRWSRYFHSLWTVVSTTIIGPGTMVYIGLLLLLVCLLTNIHLLFGWWLYRIFSLTKFIHRFTLIIYNSLWLFPNRIFTILSSSSTSRIYQMDVVSFAVIGFVEIFKRILKTKIIINIGNWLLLAQELLVFTLNRARCLVAFISMRRNRIESFEIYWLGGEFLVLSCSIIVGIASSIVMIDFATNTL